MRPAPFRYLRPDSLDEAIACLRRYGPGARVLAGGQSLLPLMYRRLVRPAVLVDVGRLTELRFLTARQEGLRIGALTTHRTLETAALPPGFTAVTETARLIGHLPVRTRGTLGGSLAHAAPAAQWPVLAVLLDAEITAAGPLGSRTLKAAEFFTGPHRTALGEDEMVVAVSLPRPAPSAAIAQFGAQDGAMPLVTAAATVELTPERTVSAARIVVSGVEGRPVALPRAAKALVGTRADDAAVAAAAAAVPGLLDAADSPRAPASYRLRLAETLTARAARAATRRAAAVPAGGHA
ncbi:FAD binding domain-containing protein [Streptomyces boninensis]|uniref:FAD binding domain-containing protein n=1 Tax=Streptomyces boninensis TaxID=2039455 RepID=UPI003B218A9B